jgi:hypothetical protein
MLRFVLTAEYGDSNMELIMISHGMEANLQLYFRDQKIHHTGFDTSDTLDKVTCKRSFSVKILPPLNKAQVGQTAMMVIKFIAGTKRSTHLYFISLNSQHWSLCERLFECHAARPAGLVEGASHGTHPSLMDFL